MTPVQMAKEWLSNHPECGTWDDAIKFHMEHGYVWSSPQSFCLAQDRGDNWLIWLAAGDVAEFFEVCPVKKEFVCFVRRGFPKVWEFERIKRLLCKTSSPHLLLQPSDSPGQSAASLP